MVTRENISLLAEYIDEGYVVQCSNQEETEELLDYLDMLGYEMSEYTKGLLRNYSEYDPEYPNVGIDTAVDKIDCWSDVQMLHPMIKYSDIISCSCIPECDTDEDFESNLIELLS